MTYELTIEPIGQTIEVETTRRFSTPPCVPSSVAPTPAATAYCATCKVVVTDGGWTTATHPVVCADGFRARRGQDHWPAVRASSDVTIEAEIEEDPDAESIPVRISPAR